MDEISRIKQYYNWRRNHIKIWTIYNPVSFYTLHQRERNLIRILQQHHIEISEETRILEIGCGYGNVLRGFINYGAVPSNLYGVDLMKDRIERAKELNPAINYICASAEELPYSDDWFNIVLQFTCFSSILDYTMQNNIAKEMLRVLKPAGCIIWYDMSEKTNTPNYRGLSSKRIGELFPHCDFVFSSVGLKGSLTGRFVKRSWILCETLEKFRVFNTHYLALIVKP